MRQIDRTGESAVAGKGEWLLLIHQLPPRPDAFRVKIWRKLQRTGALPLKNSVYVIPNVREARQAMERLIREIHAGGGEAFLCDAHFLSGLDRAELVRQFNEQRDRVYSSLRGEIEAQLKESRAADANVDSEWLMKTEHALGRIRRLLDENIALDFFSARGRGPAERLFAELQGRVGKSRVGESAEALSARSVRDYQGRTWLTRAGLYVDRLASAWLIERFIDPKGRFKFINPDSYSPKSSEVGFDFVGAEFTHVGDLCTFEVLLRSFSLRDAALGPISEIIHDLDIQDQRYQRDEAPGVEALIRGIVKTEADDDRRLKRAFHLFDELHASFRARDGKDRNGKAQPGSARPGKGSKRAHVRSLERL